MITRVVSLKRATGLAVKERIKVEVRFRRRRKLVMETYDVRLGGRSYCCPDLPLSASIYNLSTFSAQAIVQYYPDFVLSALRGL